MVTDKQVQRLFRLLADGQTLARAAWRTNMDEKTARKYRKLGKRPSETSQPHNLADSAQSLRGGLAHGVRTPRSQSRPPSQDDLRGVTAAPAGAVRREPTADVAAAHSPLACELGPAQGNLLRPGSRTGPAMRFRFHLDERSGRKHSRAAFSSPGLPFRADLLELGVGDDLLLGELRGSERGPAERPHRTGRECRSVIARTA